MVFKKQDTFLEKLYQISQNVYEAATFFNQFKIDSKESVKTFYEKMKDYENKGDTYIHEIIRELNKTFITPIEREDILNLAGKLDDVLDGMEACASRFFMYDIYESDEYMKKFGEYIEVSAGEIVKGMDLLRQRKMLPIREYTIRINELESEADQLLRETIRTLFKSSRQAVDIIKYKEIYEIMESVSDSCEDVADTMETIIMRNS